MKIIIIILSLVLLSCGREYSSKRIEEREFLEYHFKKGNAEEIITKYVNKYIEEDFFIILGYEKDMYKVGIVPTKDINQVVLFSMRINQTNRKVKIGKKSYYILFDFDYELSGETDKIVEDNGKEYNIIRRKAYLYDRMHILHFDKNWNFIEETM